MWAGKTKDGATGAAGLGRAVIDGPAKPTWLRERPRGVPMGGNGGGISGGAGKDRVRGGRCRRSGAAAAQWRKLPVLTRLVPLAVAGSFLPARLESLFLRVRVAGRCSRETRLRRRMRRRP